MDDKLIDVHVLKWYTYN